jgi:hypothetical protein
MINVSFPLKEGKIDQTKLDGVSFVFENLGKYL